MNTKLKKEINNLFKNLGINDNIPKENYKKTFYDYKLQTKFPTKFSKGKITITNFTK